MLFLGSLVFFFPRKKLSFIFFIVFIASLINTHFISKMGYPITWSLLNQLGDFLFLQTSIASKSIYRNVIILFVEVSFFITLWLILKSKKTLFANFGKGLVFFNILILLTSGVMYGTNNLKKRFSKNIIFSLAAPPTDPFDFIKREELADYNPSKWITEDRSKSLKENPKNIVVIVTETLTDTFENSELVLPYLSELKKRGRSFENHYTPWPFSSKSLFSLICGVYPHPSSLIELRINQKRHCDSWMTSLIRTYNYNSYLFYSGPLHYDNMGPFFKQQGVANLFGRKRLLMRGPYKENLISIDDQSLVDSFEDVLKSQGKLPFVSFFITMNSHFPFWTPKASTFNSEDPYRNALNYQDRIIKKIDHLLKKYEQDQNTILIVTGDHGRRETTNHSSPLPQKMFKVPLVIVEKGLKAKKVTYPTSHAYIGSSIHKMAVGKNYGYLDFNLESQKEVFLFFQPDELVFGLLKENKRSLLYENTIYSESELWPNYSSPRCSFNECENVYKTYFDIFYNLEIHFN